MAARDLFTAANEYLVACHEALATTQEGAPTRYFISPGPPAWDCPDQLTVHVGGPSVADTLPQGVLDPGHRATVTGQVNLVVLTATILRCAPTVDDDGNFPTPQQLDAASTVLLDDLWAIWNYVRSAKTNDALFPPRERELIQDPAIALAPQGGIAGWQITVRVQLGGYQAFTPA